MALRVAMVCFATGLVLGWSSTGRADWELVLMGMGDENVVTDISMADERTACLVGARKTSSGSAPRIQCTQDGGQSWRSSALDTSAKFHFPMAVHLENADLGFIAAWKLESFKMIGTVYRGSAGGSVWEELLLPGPPEGMLEDVFFAKPTHGWVVGEPGVYRTSNGGDSWAACDLPSWDGEGVPRGVFFIDDQHGWIAGGKPGADGDDFTDPTPACCGFVLRTEDGGQSWQVVRQGLDQALTRGSVR